VRSNAAQWGTHSRRHNRKCCDAVVAVVRSVAAVIQSLFNSVGKLSSGRPAVDDRIDLRVDEVESLQRRVPYLTRRRFARPYEASDFAC